MLSPVSHASPRHGWSSAMPTADASITSSNMTRMGVHQDAPICAWSPTGPPIAVLALRTTGSSWDGSTGSAVGVMRCEDTRLSFPVVGVPPPFPGHRHAAATAVRRRFLIFGRAWTRRRGRWAGRGRRRRLGWFRTGLVSHGVGDGLEVVGVGVGAVRCRGGEALDRLPFKCKGHKRRPDRGRVAAAGRPSFHRAGDHLGGQHLLRRRRDHPRVGKSRTAGRRVVAPATAGAADHLGVALTGPPRQPPPG